MRKARELLWAVPVSAVALLVDISLLYLLVAFGAWHYLLAGSASFAAGVAVNYVLSVRYVFAFRRLESRAREFLVFTVIGIGGLAVNGAVLALLVEALGQHYLVAKTAAAGTTFLFNFGARRRLLFAPLGKELQWTIKA